MNTLPRYIIKVEKWSDSELALVGYVSRETDKPGHLVADPAYALSFPSYEDACDWAAFFWGSMDATQQQVCTLTVVARQ